MRADEQGTQPEATLPAIRCGVATATLPPVSTTHTGKRARYQLVINRVAAIMFAAERFITRRDNIKA